MNWGLTHGLLGRAKLAPSATALGPNTYLAQGDFLKMLAVAFLAHVIIFTIAELVPHEKVTNIPVRALSFKLGDVDRVAAYATPPAPTTPAAPVMQAMPNEVWQPTQAVPAPVTPAPLKPLPKIEPTKPQPKIHQVPADAPRMIPAEQPQPEPEPAPAIAPSPQQYVREVGAPSQQAIAAALAQAPAIGTPTGAIGGQGTQTTLTEQTAQAVRARYEQEISSWIQHHKYYPTNASGVEGRAIVRMRIDRLGNVRYYAIEQSTGSTVLDAAALDMIRRANPVPAVPMSYPAGNLVEFLIPITFKAPQ